MSKLIRITGELVPVIAVRHHFRRPETDRTTHRMAPLTSYYILTRTLPRGYEKGQGSLP